MDKELDKCLGEKGKGLQAIQEKTECQLMNLENRVKKLENKNKSIQELLAAIVFLAVVLFICIVELYQ